MLKGKGTGGNQRDPEPGNDRREQTRERRTKGNQRKAGEGEDPVGKRETGGKPAGGDRRT